MKYFIAFLPMLFGVEVLSWMCLVTIAVFGLWDLLVAIEKEKR